MGYAKTKPQGKSPKNKPSAIKSQGQKRPRDGKTETERPKKFAKVTGGTGAVQKRVLNGKPNKFVKKAPFGANKSKPNVPKSGDDKPKWFEMKKRDRKKMRQQQDNKFYQLQLEAKKVWEKLRRSDVRSEERRQIATELHGLIKGKIVNIIEAHDTSRVVECLYTNGNPEIKNSVFAEVQDKLLHYIKCKYAKNVVMSFLRHGSQQHKEAIFKAVQLRVGELFLHREAAQIISSLYDDYCNNKKKAEMAQEFYSKELTYFKSDQATTFKAAYEACQDKTAKEAMLSDFKESLLKLADKGVVKYGLYHLLLQQLFEVLEDKNERLDMIRQIQHILVEILHTKEGMQVSLKCIWHGGAKERKAIAKTFKQFVTKIATIDYGYKVLLGLLDTVDDTVMLNQTVIADLMKNRADLLKDKFGIKVLVYLMCGRNSSILTPDTIELLRKGDNNETTRKTSEIRAKELRALVQRQLIDSIVENIGELLKEPETSIAIRDTVLASDAEYRTKAFASIVELLREPFTEGDHVIEHKTTSFILKSLLQHEKSEDVATFGRLIKENLDGSTVRSWWKCNRGAFLCVKLVECKDAQVNAWAKKLFAQDKKSISAIRATNKGAEVLLEHL